MRMEFRKFKLSEITDSCLGKMLDQNKNKGEYLPYLANINVRWGAFDLMDLPQMRFEEKEQDRYGLKKGDLIVCEGGEPGRCAIWMGQLPNMKIQKALHRIRAKSDKVDYRWLFYWFLLAGKRHALEQYFTGATIKHLPGDKLKNITINLPLLKHQRRIADILSAYDDLIENNRKQIALLEEAAQRLYKEWFVDFRFPGHETAEWENGLPKGWKEGKAQDFFDISIGKTPPRAEKKCFSTKHGIKWASISDMGSGDVYLFDTSEFLTEEAVREYHVKVIPTGSVLLSFKLTVGRIAITTEDITTNEAIAHFRITEEKIREYVYFYLKNFSYSTLGSTSSIAKAINSKIVKALPFCIPDDITLAKFSQKVMPLFNRIRILLKQNRNMTVTRDALLPRLMSGKIEVTA